MPPILETFPTVSGLHFMSRSLLPTTTSSSLVYNQTYRRRCGLVDTIIPTA